MCTREVEITAEAARWVTAVLKSRANSICLQTCFCTSIHPEVYFSLLSAQEQNAPHGFVLAVGMQHMRERIHRQSNCTMTVEMTDAFSIEEAWAPTVSPLCSPYVHFSGSLPQSSNIHGCMASFPYLVGRLTKTNECKSMHAWLWSAPAALWSPERSRRGAPSPCQITAGNFSAYSVVVKNWNASRKMYVKRDF